MKRLLLPVLLSAAILGCSAGSVGIASARESSSPVSVMEDRDVDKSGTLEVLTDDIEAFRGKLYDLAKALDGYIYFEKYRTVNVDQHTAVIKIALYNASFLDGFNEIRKLGALVSSEISASLEKGVQEEPSTADGDLAPRKTRSSSIVVYVSQKASMGNYINLVLGGLGGFFSVAVPYALGGIVIMLFAVALVLVCYIVYHGLIRKIFRIVDTRFNVKKRGKQPTGLPPEHVDQNR